MFNLVSAPDAGLIYVQGPRDYEGIQGTEHLKLLQKYRNHMLTPGEPLVIGWGEVKIVQWYLNRVSGGKAAPPAAQPHKFTAEEIAAFNAPVLAAVGASRQEILEAVGEVDEATLATFGLKRA